MQKIICYLILFFSSFQALSQQEYYTVYLKNSDIVKGILIEKVPQVSITLQLSDQSIRKIQWEEIDHYVNDEKKKPKGFTPDTIDYKKRGYVFSFYGEYGRGMKSLGNFDRSFGIHLINSYRHNPSVQIGIGVGLEKYTLRSLIPLFFELRLSPKSFSMRSNPSFNIAIGNGFIFNDGKFTDEGGLMFHPSFGWRNFIGPKCSYQLAFGYRLQKATVYNYMNLTADKVNFSFLTVNIGFSF